MLDIINEVLHDEILRAPQITDGSVPFDPDSTLPPSWYVGDLKRHADEIFKIGTTVRKTVNEMFYHAKERQAAEKACRAVHDKLIVEARNLQVKSSIRKKHHCRASKGTPSPYDPLGLRR